MSERSFRFTHAITRRPSRSVALGLRAVDRGAPEYARMREQHADYVAALRSTGATVIELAALEDFPDSVFVEDTALCLPEGALLLRPGAPSRRGEVAAMAAQLRALYGEVRALEGPGWIDGGDVLVTEREILVGRSGRTDEDGIAALAGAVAQWGYSVRAVTTPPGVLHLKTDCSLLDGETILATPRLADSGCFAGYRVIVTAPEEEAAANCARFNDLVLMPAGFVRTAARVAAAGLAVRMVGNSECAKLDGGMSCLSLRFTPPSSLGR